MTGPCYEKVAEKESLLEIFVYCVISNRDDAAIRFTQFNIQLSKMHVFDIQPQASQ